MIQQIGKITFLKKNIKLWNLCALILLLSHVCFCDDKPLLDKSAKRDLTQALRIKLHQQAIDDISTEEIKQGLAYFANTTHFAGTPDDIRQGAHVQSLFANYGFDKVEIKKYNVLVPLPGVPGSVTLNDESGKEVFRTQMYEKVLDKSENNSLVTPPYNGYSPPGKVTGKLVYVYYGRTRDFQKLAEQGVNITGKIVIARYGRGNRAKKVGRAQKFGAIGVIFYSDPEDTASMGLDKVYPYYNALPSTAVVRGSVKINIDTGDLLTPLFPSIDGIYRRPMADIQDNIPKVPVFPISYGDAQVLLNTLTGKLPRSYWKGGLPIDYGTQTDATDTRRVTLTVNNELNRRDIHNVIGYIRGYEEPDHLVILGSHRDAWVYGGTDASSGTAVIMELARVFGSLQKSGWKPRRTIVFASWDAEEIGIVGSCEWVEEHANILKARAVAYINVDQAIDGNFTFIAKTMPLLETVVVEASKKVQTPVGNESIYDQWVRITPNRLDPKLPKFYHLTMASDYAWFKNFVGVPSLDVRYTYRRGNDLGNLGNPLYHTLHDTYRLLAVLMDPTFKYHQATARVMGHVVLALADSTIIPFNVSYYAQRIGHFRDELLEVAGAVLIENSISLNSLNTAITKFADAAELFDEVIQHTSPSDTQNVFLINSRLVALEKAFIHVGENPIIPGSTGRRHCLVSQPTLGRIRYFPGIIHAVKIAKKRKGSWEDVKKQISIVVYSLTAATKLLDLTPI